MSENPALAALEAYRRAKPHRSDEIDEAFARFDPDSEAASAPALTGESDPDAASEQTELELPGE